MNGIPFQAGGPLPADAAVYIPRSADQMAITHLSRMEYITLVEPRQQGKTSLINQLIGRFSSQGYTFAYRDLMAAKASAASPTQWYTSLSKRLLEQLHFVPQGQCPPLPTDSTSWEDFLASVAACAEAARQNTVIVLDEIGAMPPEWATDFFSIIRSVYTSRQNLSRWRYLTFIIAGAFNPNELIRDKDVSRFNVDQRITLDDFNLLQAKQLVAHLGLPGDLSESVAERIHHWTDGQPYLCQRLCLCLAEQEGSVTISAVDNAVEWLLREETHYLSRIKDLNDEPELLAYVRRISKGPRPRFSAAVNDRHFRLAHIIGVIKAGADGCCQIRNRICERALAETETPPGTEAIEPLPSLRGDGRIAPLPKGLPPFKPGPIHSRWALLVGVNSYVDPPISSLYFGVNDVLALEKLLKTLGYTVITLNDIAPEKRLLPTRNNVEAELALLSQAAGPDDLMWVHFSCHGTLNEGQPVLLLQDTRLRSLKTTSLPLAEVERQMRAGKARRLVLTLDACHVGVETGRDLADPGFIHNAYELAEGFALIAGSTAQQKAQEWQDEKHGVFTYFLLEGLSHHTGKRFVTVDDLRLHVLDGLRRWSVEQGGLLQEPTARTEGLGDIILADYRD